jgi:hypothetical protein
VAARRNAGIGKLRNPRRRGRDAAAEVLVFAVSEAYFQVENSE